MTPIVSSAAPKSWSDKLLIALWLLIPASIVGISAFGLSSGELLASVAFSFLPASIITVVAVAVASVRTGGVSKFARPVWLVVSLVALLAAIVLANRPIADALRDTETLLVYVMLILSFPFGLVVPFLLMGIADLWSEGSDFVDLVATWLVFFIIGYWQWFKLLPWLRDRKMRRVSSTT